VRPAFQCSATCELSLWWEIVNQCGITSCRADVIVIAVWVTGLILDWNLPTPDSRDQIWTEDEEDAEFEVASELMTKV
jgi:hypothetical protein